MGNRTLMPLLLDLLVLSTAMVLTLSLMLPLLLTSSWMDPLAKYGLMAPSPRSVPSALFPHVDPLDGASLLMENTLSSQLEQPLPLLALQELFLQTDRTSNLLKYIYNSLNTLVQRMYMPSSLDVIQ